MNNNPLITIITVVYNAVSTIEKTILSVVNQTYDNVEYIIIDGGSTDGTIDIIKKYETQIANWISEPDKGIYDAMNKGINLANGEWINFMNAGDSFYENDTIEKFIELCDDRNGIIYGDSRRFFDVGVYFDRGALSNLDYMPNCHQAFFVKTHLLKSKHFDTNYQICADAKFFCDIHKLGYKYQHIPVVICNYENTKGLSSLSKNEKVYFSELANIEGVNQTTVKWKVKYLLFVFKLQMKRFIPKKLMNTRTKRKLDTLCVK